MTTGAEVVLRARAWVGVPWHHQGRNRNGVDCVGLIECVLEETAGLPKGYHTPRNYGRIAINDKLLEHLQRWCTPTDRPELGVVVALRIRQDRPSHVAILTGPRMIHSFQPSGAVVEQAYGEPWIRRTVGYYRLPGVSYP